MIFQPLNFNTLEQSLQLRRKVFPDINKNEENDMKYSLDFDKYKETLVKEFGISTIKYYTLLDNNKVIGLTGLYTEKGDLKKNIWLGWFCIDDSYRGKKLGNLLLEESLKLIPSNKLTLHLYTYDSDYFKPAIGLYLKYDFKEYKIKGQNKGYLFFKKELK